MLCAWRKKGKESYDKSSHSKVSDEFRDPLAVVEDDVVFRNRDVHVPFELHAVGVLLQRKPIRICRQHPDVGRTTPSRSPNTAGQLRGSRKTRPFENGQELTMSSL